MKYITSLLLLFFVFSGLHSQVLPTLPSKPKPQPAATKQPKPQAVSKTANNPAPVGPVQTIKFMSDAEGDLYIDGEKKGHLQVDVPLKVKLAKGDYVLKVVGSSNNDDQIKQTLTVSETGSDRIYEINLQQVINSRLQQEQVQRNEMEIKKQYDKYVKSIKTITIGKQIWMQENLNVEWFRNGELIPQAKSAEEWKRYGEMRTAAWCYYDNDPANGEIYGKLYNWYAVNDPRGLAPTGWHLPSNSEWTTLIDYLGEFPGAKMKSTIGWKDNGNGSNNSGFTALPGGYREYYIKNEDYSFNYLGGVGFWWSSTENNTITAWRFNIVDSRSSVESFGSDNKGLGFSVRCVRD